MPRVLTMQSLPDAQKTARNLILSLVAVIVVVGLLFGQRDAILILSNGVQVLSKPEPIRSKTVPYRYLSSDAKVIGELHKGDKLEIYGTIDGKDYRMFKIWYDGSVGYVQYNSGYLSVEEN